MKLDFPRLMFSPRAWLKWQYLCHAGPTEIGAFGMSRESDLLHVEDLIVPRQRTTAVSVAFDDASVADLFDGMADAGVPAARFARLWLHTHPGASVTPSSVDEATFTRVFGGNDWAVMAILGRTGRTSARLRFNSGPGGAMEIPVAVDWPTWPTTADAEDWPYIVDGWREEHDRLVEPVDVIAEFNASKKLKPPQLPPVSNHQPVTSVAASFNDWLFSDDPFFNPGLVHDRR
jgi:proteasome lid subunit RPN8/RPN11